MTAKQQLQERVAGLPEAEVSAFAQLVEDALPAAFRSAPAARPGETLPSSRAQFQAEINALTEDESREILEYVEWITSDEPEELTDEEWVEVRKAERRMARGEFVTLDELKRDLGL